MSRSMVSVRNGCSVVKKCAFCKHWYDPANSKIRPENSFGTVWSFEPGVRSLCAKKHCQTFSNNCCPNYEGKQL